MAREALQGVHGPAPAGAVGMTCVWAGVHAEGSGPSPDRRHKPGHVRHGRRHRLHRLSGTKHREPLVRRSRAQSASLLATHWEIGHAPRMLLFPCGCHRMWHGSDESY